MIAGLLLAAGRSTRFGGDKLLAPLCGRPVLYWSAAALAAEVDVLYVVVPPLPDSAARLEALAGIPAELVEHAGRDAGMASSIRAGVAALPADAEAVVIALADQPRVSPRVVRALCERWRNNGGGAVVPLYRDGQGHPVLFGRAHFAALGEQQGDRGARALLERLGDACTRERVDATRPADVDTPEALRALAAMWGGGEEEL